MTGARALFSLILWAWAAVAAAQDFTGLARVQPAESQVFDQRGELVVDLALTQGVPWRVFTLDEPRRIVMDFREVDWQGANGAHLLKSELATDLRVGAYRAGWSRMVLTIDAPLLLASSSMRIDPETGAARLTARFAQTDAASFSAAAGAPRDPAWELPEPAVTAPPPRRDGPLRVVLDPGHGGIDPGALRDDVVEKDLMLTFAREFKEALVRAGAEVILTRDGDEFVSLERRVSIAHQAQADLFLSLHADVLPEGHARGSTIHTLSDSASDEASAKLAERHDRSDLLSGVDLTGKDDVVADVLFDLARMETRPRTEKLATALVLALDEAAIPLNSRPRRSAGYSVLKAADIPSVLIELGFLSNDRDRKNLTDPAFRARLAAALRDAVLAWRLADEANAGLVRR